MMQNYPFCTSWTSRLLSELGHEVIVANARQARLVRIDLELLYSVKHRSAQAQADLMMIRACAGLLRARRGLVNTARG